MGDQKHRADSAKPAKSVWLAVLPSWQRVDAAAGTAARPKPRPVTNAATRLIRTRIWREPTEQISPPPTQVHCVGGPAPRLPDWMSPRMTGTSYAGLRGFGHPPPSDFNERDVMPVSTVRIEAPHLRNSRGEIFIAFASYDDKSATGRDDAERAAARLVAEEEARVASEGPAHYSTVRSPE